MAQYSIWWLDKNDVIQVTDLKSLAGITAQAFVLVCPNCKRILMTKRNTPFDEVSKDSVDLDKLKRDGA